MTSREPEKYPTCRWCHTAVSEHEEGGLADWDTGDRHVCDGYQEELERRRVDNDIQHSDQIRIMDRTGEEGTGRGDDSPGVRVPATRKFTRKTKHSREVEKTQFRIKLRQTVMDKLRDVADASGTDVDEYTERILENDLELNEGRVKRYIAILRVRGVNKIVYVGRDCENIDDVERKARKILRVELLKHYSEFDADSRLERIMRIVELVTTEEAVRKNPQFLTPHFSHQSP